MATRKAKRQPAKRIVRVNRTVPARSIHTRSDPAIPSLKVPSPFQGFINFVREQGVVGLGVGFIVGTSANALIKSIVNNLLTPVIGMLTGGVDLSQKAMCINSVGGVCKNSLHYGQVLSDIITFLVILAVVYFLVKSLKLDKLDKPKASK